MQSQHFKYNLYKITAIIPAMRSWCILLSFLAFLFTQPTYALQEDSVVSAVPAAMNTLGRGFKNVSTENLLLLGCVGFDQDCGVVQFVELDKNKEPRWVGYPFPSKGIRSLQKKLKQWHLPGQSSAFKGKESLAFTLKDGWNWVDHPLELKAAEYGRVLESIILFSKYYQSASLCGEVSANGLSATEVNLLQSVGIQIEKDAFEKHSYLELQVVHEFQKYGWYYQQSNNYWGHYVYSAKLIRNSGKENTSLVTEVHKKFGRTAGQQGEVNLLDFTPSEVSKFRKKILYRLIDLCT